MNQTTAMQTSCRGPGQWPLPTPAPGMLIPHFFWWHLPLPLLSLSLQAFTAPATARLRHRALIKGDQVWMNTKQKVKVTGIWAGQFDTCPEHPVTLRTFRAQKSTQHPSTWCLASLLTCLWKITVLSCLKGEAEICL